MAGKALETVKNAISKLGLKAPWKMTGVASTPEYLPQSPTATQWRTTTPGSVTQRPLIPAAETKQVYDIRYWVRDSKREGMLVGGTNKTHIVKYEVPVGSGTTDEALAALSVPPTPGRAHKWGKKTALLDVENNGYT